jgi:sugar O-acyltransferase (sialic acid O-acetyltransferase NeuD family)
MSKKILIIGAGDLGQLMAHHLAQSDDFELVGFLDDTKLIGEQVCSKPVLGGIALITTLFEQKKFEEVFIAIGYKHLNFKEELFNELKAKEIPLAKFIHKSAIVDNSVKIGEGSFLLPGVILDKDVKLGSCVLLNTGVVIAHDTEVGDFCFFGPAVNLAGFIKIAPKCFLGINTTIIDNIEITTPIQTGASTTIVKNIVESGLYLGTPARIIKKVLS